MNLWKHTWEKSSFLATLYFHSSITALTVCDTEKIILPAPEKATNLGYGIWLKHATFKHPQTVGVVGNSNAALWPILEINTNSQWNDWHKYVSLAVFIHNTSYHHSSDITHLQSCTDETRSNPWIYDFPEKQWNPLKPTQITSVYYRTPWPLNSQKTNYG